MLRVLLPEGGCGEEMVIARTGVVAVAVEAEGGEIE
jgi:hypothetical protein